MVAGVVGLLNGARVLKSLREGEREREREREIISLSMLGVEK